MAIYLLECVGFVGSGMYSLRAHILSRSLRKEFEKSCVRGTLHEKKEQNHTVRASVAKAVFLARKRLAKRLPAVCRESFELEIFPVISRLTMCQTPCELDSLWFRIDNLVLREIGTTAILII